MKLFELDTEIRNVEAAMLEFAEANDGDVTAFTGIGLLVDLKSERERKLLGLGCLLKEREAEAEAVKAEANKLAKRARILQNDADRIRDFINGNLTLGEKMSDHRVAFSWRKSARVVVEPEKKAEDLPVAFVRIKTEIDLGAIREYIARGNDCDFAHLETRLNLQIK